MLTFQGMQASATIPSASSISIKQEVNGRISLIINSKKITPDPEVVSIVLIDHSYSENRFNPPPPN